MKRLIVNADDLGAGRARNQGILDAAAAGVVTSVSLLANGPALGHALERLADPGLGHLSCGLHFNLSEGSPLCHGLHRLTGPDGLFPGKAAAHALLARSGDADLEEEIVRELTAQVACLADAGLEIRHLDGHQHVHVFPAAVRPVAAAARAHGIPWIRLPWEPSPPRTSCPPLLEAEGSLFCGMARAAVPVFAGEALGTTDAFRGIYLKNRLRLDTLEESLKDLDVGLTELMVHPGRTQPQDPHDPFAAFSTAERERELQVLLHPGFRSLMGRLGLQLTPFPGAAP